MTVSDTAENRWFFYKIALAILFFLNAFGSQNAKAQITINNTPACIYLISVTLGLTLSSFPRKVPNGYTIARRSHPPAKIFKPGDTYQIRYAIGAKPSRLTQCMDIGTHDLTLAAQLHGPGSGVVSEQNATLLRGLPRGTDTKPLSEAATIIGKVRIDRFGYGENTSFTANFTVPNLDQQAGSTEIYDVKMWVCPPNIKALGCHGHVISVRNQSTPGWSVSRLTPRVRAIGAGVNPVAPNRLIPLTAVISQVRGWPLTQSQSPKAYIKQISAPGLVATGPPPTQSVPGLGGGKSATMQFQVGPLTPGVYFYQACLQDLPPRPNGWPAADICGPQTRLTVIAGKVRPPPQPVAPVANSCTGGRAKNAQGRCVCPVGSFWNPNPGFKRCYTCTGGRVWNNAQRRCVCPSGTKWNPRANRCGVALQILPTPGIRLPALGAPPAIKCAGGTVSNRSCLCPRGFTRKTIRTNVYVCKPPFRRPVPGASQIRPSGSSSATTLQNQLKKPAAGKMQCLGGQVKGPLCWCGIGRFPKKIGNNVYRCQ